MRRESDRAKPTLLERLDVVLAERLSRQLLAGEVGPEALIHQQFAMPVPTVHTLRRSIAGALSLRGLRISEQEVCALLDGTPCRFPAEAQERKLVRGLWAAMGEVRDSAAGARLPDGRSLLCAFQRLTADLSRFRNNALRKDQPWDAVPHVRYPEPAELQDLVDELTGASSYQEVPAVWAALHPVRRAFRLLWRIGRIAPFPDFNLVMATVGMNHLLLAQGYPLLVPEASDRPMLRRLIAGRAPVRVVTFEARLLESAAGEPVGEPGG